MLLDCGISLVLCAEATLWGAEEKRFLSCLASKA
jgi:hypothetical protein